MEVIYKLLFVKDALKDRDFWKKSGNKQVLKKIDNILLALAQDPDSTTPGEPEKLRYAPGWSRRINKKDRVTYTINKEKREVVILRMRGHYEDK